MRSRWFVLAALFLARTSLGFQFQSVGSTTPILSEALHLSYAQIGSLIGFFMLPGIVVSIPGGILGNRFADKYVCALGFLLIIAGGLIFGASHTFAIASIGRLTSGAGFVLANVAITKMLADWFAGREIVTAMAVMLASWPCGIAAGLVIQPTLAATYGWPVVMLSTAVVGALALLLLIGSYRPPSNAPAMSPTPTESLKARLSLREGVACLSSGAIWGVFNVGLVVFFSFAPAVLGERGLELRYAGPIVSLGLWVSTVSLPLGGYITERLGRPSAAIMLFPTMAGCALGLLPFVPAAALLCAVVGAAIGPPAGAIVALPSKVLHPSRRSVGLGVFYTSYYIIMAVGPAIAGAMRDHWATADAAALFGSAMFLVVPTLFLAYRHFIMTRPLEAATVVSQ